MRGCARVDGYVTACWTLRVRRKTYIPCFFSLSPSLHPSLHPSSLPPSSTAPRSPPGARCLTAAFGGSVRRTCGCQLMIGCCFPTPPALSGSFVGRYAIKFNGTLLTWPLLQNSSGASQQPRIRPPKKHQQDQEGASAAGSLSL